MNREPIAVSSVVRAVVIAALSGCGSTSSPPSISNLSYAPDSAVQDEGGGSVVISGSFDFVDADGDLASVHVAVGAQDGVQDLSGVAGMKTGTLRGGFRLSTAVLGRSEFQIWVVDSKGAASNKLGGVFEVVIDDTASTWTHRVAPTTAGLRRVIWSGSQFVAVGERGTILTSPDGILWTSQSSGTSNILRGIAGSGTQLIAVGEAMTMLGSSDGVWWTSRNATVPAGDLAGVAWSGTQFAAVGSGYDAPSGKAFSIVVTSPDGIAWTQRTSNPDILPNSIVWSGTQFIAAGVFANAPNALPAMITSVDGIAWQSRFVTANPGSFADVASNGSRSVAVGYAVFESEDGVLWEQVGAGSVTGSAVAWGARRFLTCDFRCATSTDGTTWMGAGTPPGNMVVSGLAWSGMRWVAVGPNGMIASSP